MNLWWKFHGLIDGSFGVEQRIRLIFADILDLDSLIFSQLFRDASHGQ